MLLRAAKLRRDGGWTDQARVGQAARDSLRSAWVSLNHRLGPTRDRWSWGGLHRLQFIAFATEGHSSPRELRSLAVAGSGQTLDFARHRLGVSFRVERLHSTGWRWISGRQTGFSA